MNEKMKDFLGGPWPDRVVNLVTVAGLGWAASLFGQLAEMSVAYPVPLGCACALSFLIGVGFARLSGCAKAKRRKVELEDARMREEAQRAEAEKASEENRIRDFKHLPFDQKMFIASIYDSGPAEEPEFSTYTGRCLSSLEYYGWCESEQIEFGRRWTLSERCSALIDAHPDLIGDARRGIDEMRAYERGGL